jgi:hypothetical protein
VARTFRSFSNRDAISLLACSKFFHCDSLIVDSLSFGIKFCALKMTPLDDRVVSEADVSAPADTLLRPTE